MAHTYEIEIKSLLGTAEVAEKFRKNLFEKYPAIRKIGQSKQLNHYFTNGDVATLQKKIETYINPIERDSLAKLIKEGSNLSVRTRAADNQVRLIIKASLNDHSSHNGVSRIEWEAVLPLSIEALDEMLLQRGFAYQAKWSREREEFITNDMHICIDKNAGYGYLVEFEKVIQNADKIEETKRELMLVMADLGCAELSQERIERMFAYYNEHWPDYYGTDKVFIVE